jgi:hypothetical protein
MAMMRPHERHRTCLIFVRNQRWRSSTDMFLVESQPSSSDSESEPDAAAGLSVLNVCSSSRSSRLRVSCNPPHSLTNDRTQQARRGKAVLWPTNHSATTSMQTCTADTRGNRPML